MEILIASAHIIGSIIVWLVFAQLRVFVDLFELGKTQTLLVEEISATLGIDVDDFDLEKHAQKILKLSNEKFSNELFKNRFSDFCGVIRTVLKRLMNIIQALVIVAVLWYAATDSTENAVYAWLLVGISIFSLMASVIFSLTCQLLTGRHPGQAKWAREAVPTWMHYSGSHAQAPSFSQVILLFLPYLIVSAVILALVKTFVF